MTTPTGSIGLEPGRSGPSYAGTDGALCRGCPDPAPRCLARRRIHPGHQLVAPNSVRSDALSLLYDQVRRGELAEDEALRLHERRTEVRMRLLGDRVSRRVAWRIAREQGWDTIRDAEYLAVTQLQADALIALDASLARRASGIVPLVSRDALTSEPGA